MIRPVLAAPVILLLAAATYVSPALATPTVTAANLATAPTDANRAAVVEITGAATDRFDRQLAQTFLAATSGVLQCVAVTARAGTAQTDGLGLSVTIAPFDTESGLLGDPLAIAPADDVEQVHEQGRTTQLTAVHAKVCCKRTYPVQFAVILNRVG